uniref:CCHC-type domain-containing protein n=1 Tax=Meloidogyne hapla TaxID=6305 RepID=A0A1I8BFE7_MELHA
RRAKESVQGLLPFSEANYILAVDLLKSKYGKNEKIIRDLHNKLSSILESRSIEDDIVNQVEVERICRQLEHYKQDLKSPQIFLALEQKMSKKVLLKYLDLKQNDGTDPWTTAMYRKCYAKAVEHCQLIKEIYRKGKKDKVSDKKSSKAHSGEPSSPTMNFAIRYQPRDTRKNWRDSDEGPSRSRSERKREKERTWKNRPLNESDDSSGRTSSHSSASSNTSTSPNRNNRNLRVSPWPRSKRSKGKGFERSESSSTSRSPARYPCQLCQGMHFPLDCDKYKTIEERKRQIEELALCYICLRKGHDARECSRYTQPCFLCKRPKHNVALCRKRVPKTEHATVTVYENEISESNEVNTSLTTRGCMRKPEESFTLLKCVKVTIYNPQKPHLRKRVVVFLDPGSERSYITKNLGEVLELEPIGQARFNISGLGGVKLGTYESQIVEFGVKGKNCDRVLKARTMDKVMSNLKFVKYRRSQLENWRVNKIKAKPETVTPEVLIGSDYYDAFNVIAIERLANGFFINDSSLGKFLSGEGRIKLKENREVNNATPSVVLASVQEDDIEFETSDVRTKSSDLELNKLVERQINLETIGLADADIDEDKLWLEKFKQNLRFNGERYEVKLIWNEEVNNLPNNYVLALGRLRSNKKKLNEKPQLLKQYHEIITDQLKRNMIEIAPKERQQICHYLPHHFVERQDKQFTKIRIVFDASAKLRKEYPSLNECLHKGPNLYNDLAGILLRARMKNYLLTCDVEKAFLQISIAPEDRDALRFLWYENPEDEQSAIAEYRFSRVAFGVICSPAHLAIILKHHYENYSDAVVRELEINTYVDNLLIGINSPEQIQDRYKLLKRIFSEANMNVREFTSNAWQEITKLPESDRGGTESSKLLGLAWNLKEDTLTIKLPKFTEEKVTRRTILSQIAKPFDPLGLISPIILKGKLLRQQAEKDKKLNWDKPVDQKSEEDWKKLIASWNDQSINISRKIWNLEEKNKSKIELHGFADASGHGLGCVIYLRTIGNKIETTLAFAKSLVIPSQIGKRKTSTPSLELHAMKICCTNIEFVKRELEKENKIEKIRLWTDAADVIDYLRTVKEKDRFVKNRIKVIRNYHVTHVVGTDNPADLASRGCSIEELKESQIWFKGPEWLSKEESFWPTSLKDYDPETFVPLEKTNSGLQLSLVAKEIDEEITPICDFERFSQWKRSRNSMAYVLRAVELFKNQEAKMNKNPNCDVKLIPPLTTGEIKDAEILLIIEAQEMFPPKEESIQNLGLFQKDGIWRAGGRLQRSELEPNAIHPIYLSPAAPIVPLIIKDMHRERKHTGTINLCAALRQTYWIPKCRKTVANVTQKNQKTKCHLCERYYSKAYDYPEAPPLPNYRVSGNEIWETVGIDYFGPMTVKSEDGKSTLKMWGAIFVCALSRLIHLELVLDATAEKFLLAFTRFARRWRIPKRIISDNGTNFVLGSKGLKKLCQENAKERQLWLEIYEDREVKEYSTTNKIEWIFITPFAPWRGGLYERMIGVVKHHLKRVIARKTMTTEEM